MENNLDKIESFKAEIYKKTFEACHKMYDCDMFLCEIALPKELRENTEKERQELYEEIVGRIQDYDSFLYDETEELNFDDYETL